MRTVRRGCKGKLEHTLTGFLNRNLPNQRRQPLPQTKKNQFRKLLYLIASASFSFIVQVRQEATMGKRRSKTSKQKQAKAAAKSMKARVVKEQVVKHPATQQRSPPIGVKKNRGSPPGEDEDFRRQQASMQERLKAEIQQQRRFTKKLRGGKKKREVSSFAFHPPTLIVDDKQKSTTQLMKEMASKVHGWDGISEQPQKKQQQEQTEAKQSSVSLKHIFQNSTLQKRPAEQLIEQRQRVANRFFALNNDENSDNEQDQSLTLQQNSKSLFQFAPPSFAIPSTADDVDPDL
jgi:hypothetical protein